MSDSKLEAAGDTGREDDDVTPSANMYMIGIGASAGGLEAIRELLSNAPRDIPAAYVVVQHMSPRHKSLLTALIDRETHLQVADIEDGIVPTPNTVFVTPPRHDVIYRDKALRLLPPNMAAGAPKPSVDRFFESIADGFGDRAIGIVLSGTGSDGARGIAALHKAGGFAFAQSIESARYDGMPNAAIRTNVVDLVLTPSEIAEQLAKLPGALSEDDLEGNGEPAGGLRRLFQLLLARFGTDFSEYKTAMIERRVSRRMAMLHFDALDQYVNHCKSNPAEVQSLFRDLLISVTRFFRDTQEFMSLGSHLTKFIDNGLERPLRVWVPGCATGEEAYTIAILIAEKLGGPEFVEKRNLQIFATDIDTDALAIGRQGKYHLDSLKDVSPNLIRRYFKLDGSEATIRQSLRDVVMFTKHNVTRDAPFIRVHLISCRNLLIYFKNALQDRVLSRFHYALRPDGVLFLGTSDSVGLDSELFFRAPEARNAYLRASVNKPAYIAPSPDIAADVVHPLLDDVPAQPSTATARGAATENFQALARGLGEGALLFNDKHEILQIFGTVDKFVSLSDGTGPRMDTSIIIEPLRRDAAALLSAAATTGRRQHGALHGLPDDPDHLAQLECVPLIATTLKNHAILAFNRRKKPKELLAKPTDDLEGARQQRISELERELTVTNAALNSTIEDLRLANEHLRATSEEMRESNHALVALNEEMQTANEEMSSSNEELVTVNEQLQITTRELSELSDEQAATLEHIGLPILVLNADCVVTKASKEASEMLSLPRPMVRTHISQCPLPKGFPSLSALTRTAMEAKRPVHRDVHLARAKYDLKVTPILDEKEAANGVIVVIFETSDASELAEEFQHMLRNAPLLLSHRDGDGNILRIGREAARQLGSSVDKAEGANLHEIIPGAVADKIIGADRAFLRSGLEQHGELVEYKLNPDEPPRWFWLERYRRSYSDGAPDTVYIAGADLTERHTFEEKLRAANEHLDLAQKATGIAFWSIDLARGEIFWSDKVYDIHGVTRDTYVPNLKTAIEFYHPDDRPMVTDLVDKAIENAEPFEFEARLVRADGDVVTVQSQCEIDLNDNGEVRRVYGIFHQAH